MNVGITTIYAHRPSIYFAAYVAEMLKRRGDNVSSLVCDASLPVCYSILSKNKSKLTECPFCIVGGLRSYKIDSYYSIDKDRAANLTPELLDDIVRSSIMTLERAEFPGNIEKDRKLVSDIDMLKEAVAIAYQNTIDWIEKESLDLVICYNGRMDITRAVISACASMNTKYITLERPLYGYGIQLIPNNNCLSLKDRVRMNHDFSEIELSNDEKEIADLLSNLRVSQESHLEWRTYKGTGDNVGSDYEVPKVVVFPSSASEFIGNDEWTNPWEHFTNALDELLERASFDRRNVAIKMHPVWQQNIGYKNGDHIVDIYRRWANRNRIRIIEANDTISANALIAGASIVVVGGSSAGIDAALMGKRVVLLGRAHYEGAGFVCQIRGDGDWNNLNGLASMSEEEIITKAKRYLYTATFRFPQLTDRVIPLSYSKYLFKYDRLECLHEMVRNGEVSPWDTGSSKRDICRGLRNGRRATLNDGPSEAVVQIKRRHVFRVIDYIRNWMPRGDQIRRVRK